LEIKDENAIVGSSQAIQTRGVDGPHTHASCSSLSVTCLPP